MQTTIILINDPFILKGFFTCMNKQKQGRKYNCVLINNLPVVIGATTYRHAVGDL